MKPLAMSTLMRINPTCRPACLADPSTDPTASAVRGQHSEAELASLKDVRGERHSKRVYQLRASRRYGRYLRLTKGGLLRIDAAKRREAEQLDGKFVVHSNDDSLTPADC